MFNLKCKSMKKKSESDFFDEGLHLKDVKRKMRCCLFLLWAFLVPGLVWGQEQRVTLRVTNGSVQEVFKEINRQTGLDFVCNLTQLREIEPVTLEVEDVTVEAALERLLAGTGFEFNIERNSIVIRRRAAGVTEGLTMRGRVTDERRAPIPGVTVVVKEMNIGTATDAEGRFSLTVPVLRDTTLSLVFSFVGMETQTVRYRGQDSVVVVMKEEVREMDEVVVMGYVNVRKESFTGNVTTVKKDELLKTNNRNVLQALQVFDPSFRVTQNNRWGSDPNALPEITLRGESSIATEKGLAVEDLKTRQRTDLKYDPNLPVFILDGFEVDVQRVIDLDIYRIEDITILKDAAATALYGSRAANGVVVITTVAPRTGELQVSYNLTLSASFPDLSDYNLANAAEKLEIERLFGLYEGTTPADKVVKEMEYTRLKREIDAGYRNTDWLAQPLRNAFIHSHSLYVTGGNEDIRYGFNMNYDNDNGVMKGSYRTRIDVGFNLDFRYKILQINNQIQYGVVRNEDSPYGNFEAYGKMQPYWPLYDEDGKYFETYSVGSTPVENPLYKTYLSSYYNKGDNYTITDNLGIRLRFTEEFQIESQFSISRTNSMNRTFLDPRDASFSGVADAEKGSLDQSEGVSTNWNFHVMAHYNRNFNNHYVNASVGLDLQENRSSSSGTMWQGFSMGFINNSQQAAGQKEKTTTSSTRSRLVGFLFSVNYTYNNIYLMDVSYRLDGSSEFGSNKRFAPFWSVGVGMNMHNYEWFANPVVSMLRLRASYGYTGKVNFPPSAIETTYEMDTQNWYYSGPAAYLISLGNPDLKWETTHTLDYGVNLGLFNDKVQLNFSGYHKKTVDAIDKMDIRTASGFKDMRSNVGTVENTGIELSLSATLLQRKDWYVSVTANLAHNENKISELGEDAEKYNEELNENYNNPSEEYAELAKIPLRKYHEGNSTTALYVVPSLGIDPSSGQEIYIKRDGSLTFTYDGADQVCVGDTNPKASGALSFNVTWKGIFLSANFSYQWGAKLYNQTLASKVEGALIESSNVDKRILTERWVRPGDRVPYVALRSREVNPTSRFVQDNDFVQFSGLSAGYDFPYDWTRKLKLSSLGVRFNANDICRWATSKEERGLSYPFARTFSFSLSVGF